MIKHESLLRDFGAIVILNAICIYLCHNIIEGFNEKLFIRAVDFDAIGQLWMSWWVENAFYNDNLSPFYSNYFNYPIGVNVIVQEGAYFHIYLSGILRPIFGAIGSINFVFILGNILSISGTFFLLKQITPNRKVAILYSLLIFFNINISQLPSEVYDVELSNWGFMMIALALWLKYLKKSSIVNYNLLAFCIFLALTVYTNVHYGLVVIAILVIHISSGLSPVNTINDKLIKLKRNYLLLYVLVGAFLSTKLLYPSLDLTYKFPLELLPIKITHLAEGNIQIIKTIDPLFMLASLTVVLSAICIFQRSNYSLWFWLVVLFWILILGYGPLVKIKYINNNISVTPTPVLLLHNYIPYYWRLSYHHAKICKFAVIPLSILAIILFDRIKVLVKPMYKPIFFFIVFIIVDVSSSIYTGHLYSNIIKVRTYPVQQPYEVPSIITEIGQEKDDFAIFHLSCGSHMEVPAYYQIFHKKPIAGLPLMTGRAIEKDMHSKLTNILEKLCSKDKYTSLPNAKYLHDKNVKYLIIQDNVIPIRKNIIKEANVLYGNQIFNESGMNVFRIYHEDELLN